MAVKVEKLVKKFAEKSTIMSDKVYDTHFFDTQEKDVLISVVEYDYRRNRIEKVLNTDLDDEEIWHNFCLFVRDALDKRAQDRMPDENNFKNISRKDLETIFHNVVSGVTRLPIAACQFSLEHNAYRISLRVGFAEVGNWEAAAAFTYDKRKESRVEEYPPEPEEETEGKDEAEGEAESPGQEK